MNRQILVAALALGLAVAAPAFAEDLVAFEVDGEAAVSAPDARTAALDDEFSRAATNAVAELVAPDVRAAHQVDLDREIVGHARLWVARFSVTKDDTADDRRQLSVSVRIDRDKLRARLGELNIATVTPGEPVGARPIALLVRVSSPSGVRATYGAGADKDTPGAAALGAALRDAGFAVRRSLAATAAAAELDDAAAEALAADAKADFAAIASVTIGPTLAVRGVAAPAALVAVRVRVVDRAAHRSLGEGMATAAARGESPAALAAGVDRAIAAAIADALPPPTAAITQAGAFSGDDTPIAESGVVLVRLPSKTSWRAVLDEQKYLAGTRGVKSVSLHRVSPAGWVLGVVTADPIDRIAAVATKSPGADPAAPAKVVSNVIELTLSTPP